MSANAQNTNVPSTNSMAMWSLVVSAVTLLLVAVNTFGGNAGVQKAIENVEAMKVGGSDNYAIVKEIYASDAFKTSQKTSLEAAKQQMAGAAPTDTTTPPTDTTTTPPTDTTTPPSADAGKKITAEQLAAIKSAGLWDGSKDAKIILLEYSDLQCPFCKRHHDNGTIKSLLTKYDGKISHSFRQFPLSFHPYATPGANASLCAADQGGTEMFYKYIDGVFTKDLTAESVLTDVATDLKLDMTKFADCMTKKPHSATVTAEMNEGQTLFAINGTPGNVMINTETLEWVAVAGAYPASEFEKTLDLWTK